MDNNVYRFILLAKVWWLPTATLRGRIDEILNKVEVYNFTKEEDNSKSSWRTNIYVQQVLFYNFHRIHISDRSIQIHFSHTYKTSLFSCPIYSRKQKIMEKRWKYLRHRNIKRQKILSREELNKSKHEVKLESCLIWWCLTQVVHLKNTIEYKLTQCSGPCIVIAHMVKERENSTSR